MKKLFSYGSLAAALALGAALPSCARPASPADTGPQDSPQEARQELTPKNAPLAVTVTPDKKSYRPGEAITITLTVKNKTKQNQTLSFFTGQRYDFEIRQAGNKSVWKWSNGRMFTQAQGTITIAPGKSLTYAETFTPGANDAPPLPPGTYTLLAIVTTSNSKPLLRASTSLKISASAK